MAENQLPQNPKATDPSDLESPVPGASEREKILEDIRVNAGTPPGNVELQEQEPDVRLPTDASAADPLADIRVQGGAQPATAEEALNQAFGMEPEEPSPIIGDAPVPGRFQAEPGPEGFDRSLIDQVTNLPTRARASFAVTDKEVMQVYEDAFGDENVRINKETGQVEFRRPDQKEFRPVDSRKFEIIGDTVDLARIGTETAVDAAITGLGTIGTGFLGTSLAGAAGSVAALETGDFIQEQILDIERDPNRDRLTEASLAGTLGAGFNVVGAALARRAASKGARDTVDKVEVDKPVKKFLEGLTKEEKASTLSTIRRGQQEGIAADQIITSRQVRDNVEDFVQAKEVLREAGIEEEADNLLFIAPQQLDPSGTTPSLRVAAEDVAETEGYQNFINAQGPQARKALETLMGYAGRLQGVPGGLADRFNGTVDDVISIEGKTIGQFRDEAIENAKRTKTLTTPRKLLSKFDEMNKRLGTVLQVQSGGNFKTAKMKTPTTDQIIQQFPDMDEGTAKAFRRNLEDVFNLIKKKSAPDGRMRVEGLDNIYKVINNKTRPLFRAKTASGKAHAAAMNQLRKGIRDDWISVIGRELGEDSRKQYVKQLNRFRTLKNSAGRLSKVLEESGISTDAFVKELFENQGRQRVQTIQAARNLIQQRDPQLWKDMVGQYFQKRILRDALDPDTASVNWNKVTNHFEKTLGEDVTNEIFRGTGVEGMRSMRALSKIGRLMDKDNVKFGPPASGAEKMGQLTKRVARLFLMPFIQSKQAQIEGIVDLMGKNKKMTRFLALTNKNIEKIIPSDVSPAKARVFRNKMQDVMDSLLSKKARSIEKSLLRERIQQSTRDEQGSIAPIEFEDPDERTSVEELLDRIDDEQQNNPREDDGI